MAFYGALNLLKISKQIITPIIFGHQARCYAMPGMLQGQMTKKLAGSKKTSKKIILPVETDPEKLLKYCCGTNLLVEGGQDVELKPDSEYPDWLWKVRLGPPPPLEEMDPNTKEYWRRVRKLALRRNNRIKVANNPYGKQKKKKA